MVEAYATSRPLTPQEQAKVKLERQAVRAEALQEVKQAILQAEQAPVIVLEGQRGDDPHTEMMGLYLLVHEKVVNKRGVWVHGDGRLYMYYDDGWYIGNKKSMEAEEAAGVGQWVR